MKRTFLGLLLVLALARHADAAAILGTAPVMTTLHALVSLPKPTLPSDNTTRLPSEHTIRVVDARLVKFKMEAGKTGDSDFHLVISDDTLQFSGTNTVSPHSFIAEIPDPGCVSGASNQVSFPSAFQSQLQAVHDKFVNQFANIQTDGSWNDAAGVPVRLTGVGYYDPPHGQTGRAINGIELHPLLDIEFTTTTTVPPTPTPAPGLLQDPALKAVAAAGLLRRV